MESLSSHLCYRKLFYVSILCFIFNFSSTNGKSQRNGQRRLSRLIRPNFVLLITDDQDVELGSMEFMPKTLKILRDGGAEFTNGFVTTPLCCPSRSTILTGMYVHNHHVHSNNENCTGQGWISTHEPRSIGAYLQKAGYRTGYFGKYLNEYNGSYVPVGWSDWMGLVKNSRFYNYTVNFNGVRIKHGDNYKADYFTDLVANDTLTFLRQSLMHHRDQPFFVVVSFPAPHGPEDPAPHYSTLFSNVTTHRTPSWNYAPNPDKQWILQHTGKMEPVHVAFTDFLHQRRLQTLLSVDDAVQRIFDELRDSGELDNTYIMFTSDHGYHLGQFGLIKGKMMPYDFDLKVPYFIRGPGIGRGLSLWQPVANIDIAPTVLDAAGVAIPDHMDGRSIMPVLKYETSRAAGRQPKPLQWRHAILVERGLRPKLLRLRERLQRQKEKYSKDMRIQDECDKPQYRAPCKLGQQWECRKNEIDRWRIFKCRGKIQVENECACTDESIGTITTPMTVDSPPMRRRHRSKRNLVIDGSEETSDDGGRMTSPSTSAPAMDEVSLSDWERTMEQRGEVAHVSEEQLESWEDEFFHTVIETSDNRTRSIDQDLEIISDDQQNYRDDNMNGTSTNLRRRNDRTKRSANSTEVRSNRHHRLRHSKHRRNHGHAATTKQPRNGKKAPVLVRGCSLYANHTVHCRPEIYANYDNWLQQKYKVDDRIRNLRNRLNELKGVRKHLKAGKPLEQESLLPREPGFWTSANDGDPDVDGIDDKSRYEDEDDVRRTTEDPSCTCEDSTAVREHPLRRPVPDLPSGTISDAELLAYAEERRRQRAKKRKEGGGGGVDRPNRKGDRGNNRRRNQHHNVESSREASKSFCNVPNLNCFTHDNSHWKTPPLWTLGPFCFCQNSNNNTYWCLRTVNATHDFLYCEFVTGFISYYDITKDRYQLENVVYDLSVGVIEQLSAQLDKLRTCKGHAECERCAGRGLTSRWYHVSMSEHYCNACFEHFYRAGNGKEEYEQWLQTWCENCKSQPSHRLFFAEEYLPYWLQCHRCHKWRCLSRDASNNQTDLEVTPDYVANFECKNLRNVMVGKIPTDGLCSMPEDPRIKQTQDPRWMEELSVPPMLKHSPAARYIHREYFCDFVGMSPSTTTGDHFTDFLPPTDAKVAEVMQPFYQPNENGKAMCIRPDIMEYDELLEFSEYAREQILYLGVRNLIIALWNMNPTDWLTAEKCSSHLICRGLVRVICIEEMYRIIDFLTRKGIINFGLVEKPDDFELDSVKTETRVIIIGAGISGLAAAKQLQNFGLKPIILEAKSCPGGRISDDRSLDVLVGRGAQLVTGLVNNPISLMCLQAGIEMRRLGEECPLIEEASGRIANVSNDKRVDFHFNAMLDAVEDWRTSADKDEDMEKTLNMMHNLLLEQSKLRFQVAENDLLSFHFSNLEYSCGSSLANVSSFHWDQNEHFAQFVGEHSLMTEGYSAIVDRLVADLDVRYGVEATKITYLPKSVVKIETKDGEVYTCDKVLVTLPLAVLQKETMEFEPELPKKKTTAIRSLGAGIIEKVALKFSRNFWSSMVNGADYFGHVAGGRNGVRGYFNIFYDFSPRDVDDEKDGPFVLMSYLSGNAAALVNEKSDEEIITICMGVLRRLFPKEDIPDPDGYLVTHWRNDPYAGMSYSYVKVGATGQHYDDLAETVGSKLYFAGEATNRHFPQTVTGAYLSGLREACKIVSPQSK